MIKSTTLTGTWNIKYPLWALGGYLIIIFPSVQTFLDPGGIRSAALPLYCLAILAFLILSKKATFRQLGFHTEFATQNMLLGIVAGGVVLIPIPLMDAFINISGLAESELFAGAEQRVHKTFGETSNPLLLLGVFLIIPLVEQTFLTGFVYQSLLKKYKPSLAVYLGGLIFVLMHFQFSLSAFAIGIICSWFFWMTGSLTAPILFHLACQTGEYLLTFHYPRVVTFLGFLF